MILSGSDPKALVRAATTLASGGLVALPTETVYGLAGISTSDAAVEAIYAAKGRPRSNPLISHVADLTMAERYVSFDPVSRRLAQEFWPGPLTLILPLLSDRTIAGISRSSTAGGNFAAVRAPRGFAHEVIAQLDLPLAAPSANSSGRISPTTAQHVANDLGARVPLIIDGGPCRFGVEFDGGSGVARRRRNFAPRRSDSNRDRHRCRCSGHHRRRGRRQTVTRHDTFPLCPPRSPAA